MTEEDIDDNDNESKITHTRIPDSANKITGGAYCIPENELNNFYELLYKSKGSIFSKLRI